MNKIIVIFSLFILIQFTDLFSANRFNLGFNTGLNISQQYGIDDESFDYQVSSRVNYNYKFGIYKLFPINNRINLRQMVNFANKGAQHRISAEGTSLMINTEYFVTYLEIPLLFEMQLISIGDLFFYTTTGYYFAYNLSSSYKLNGSFGNTDISVDKKLRNIDDFDYGISFGASIRYGRIVVEYLSNLGMNFIAFPTTEDIVIDGQPLVMEHEKAVLRNHSYSLTVGFEF